MANSNVVRTGIAGLIQSTEYLNRDLEVIPNSTLNQKLSIFSEISPSASDRPVLQYVGIGNGGHGFVLGSNNKTKWKARHHDPKHLGLYNQLPFVLRLVTNDLTPTERLKYRLRRLEEHHGEMYAAYYLRVLDLSNTVPAMETRHVEDGITTSKKYVPVLADLSPTPPVLTEDSALTTTGDYLATTSKVIFQMTAAEVAEFVDAVKIIEGEDGYAILSEMCTVSGIDKSVTGDFNGTSASYTDAIYCQINAHIATGWVMEMMTDGISMTLDIGNVEPLLTLTASS